MRLAILVNEFVDGLIAKYVVHAPLDLLLIVEIIRRIEVLPGLHAFTGIDEVERVAENGR